MATVTYSPVALECKYLLPCGLCELKKEKCTELGSTTINPVLTSPTPTISATTTNPVLIIPTPTIRPTDITCSAEREEQ